MHRERELKKLTKKEKEALVSRLNTRESGGDA